LNNSKEGTKGWQDELFFELKRNGIKQISFVPDAGHSRLIELANTDPDVRSIVLTTEEEGVALSCGAWLGGHKSILLMQSSGVGNCINMFSVLKSCNFPFLTLVTMRGEYEEFNSWQIPMGTITQKNLELMDFRVTRVEYADEIIPSVNVALSDAFLKNSRVAVLLSQRLIGKKVW
jgi:sulfopyruvate decarboxylase alpha subunit